MPGYGQSNLFFVASNAILQASPNLFIIQQSIITMFNVTTKLCGLLYFRHKASNPCTYASHAYQPYPRPSLPPFVLGRLLSPLDHMLHAVQIQHIHHVHNEIKLQHFQNLQISEIQRHQELPAV